MHYILLLLLSSAILVNGYYLRIAQRYCESPEKAETIKCVTERQSRVIDIYKHCVAIIKPELEEIEELDQFLCKEMAHEQFLYFDICFNGALKLHDGRGSNMTETFDHCLRKHNPASRHSRTHIRIDKYYT